MNRKLVFALVLLLITPLVQALEPGNDYHDFVQRITGHHVFARAQWEMFVEVDTYLDINGNEIAGGDEYEIMIELESDGDRVLGSYVQAEGNACSDAEIEGTMDGNEMRWVVTYTGDCCPQAEMEFTGTISLSGRKVEGEIIPISDVPENCWLWFADVTLTRQ